MIAFPEVRGVSGLEGASQSIGRCSTEERRAAGGDNSKSEAAVYCNAYQEDEPVRPDDKSAVRQVT